MWVNSGEQEVTTAVKKKTVSPYWGEEFILYVSVSLRCGRSVADQTRFLRDLIPCAAGDRLVVETHIR